MNLGKIGRDKITGFQGVIIGQATYLFGCNTYAIAPQKWNSETSKRPETEWFDEGRIEIVGDGINPVDVQVETPGGEYNFDAPKI